MAEMECGCSGIRYCLVCEKMPGLNNRQQIGHYKTEDSSPNCSDIYHFCLASSKIGHGGWKDCECSAEEEEFKREAGVNKSGNQEALPKLERRNFVSNSRLIDKESDSIQFINLEVDSSESPVLLGLDDIVIMENFVTEEEEEYLRTEIYKLPWKPSQSGRRKQDFGPQANFKRKKLKIGNFTGLPFFLKDSVSKMNSMTPLANFLPVEVCHLEYCPTRGSSIDPHIDDRWLWGERLVTLNLLSSAVLTLSNDALNDVSIEIPLPRRSLFVLQGRARNFWKHSIKRRHIFSTRLALTFRELSAEFTSGSGAKCGNDILRIASNFDGRPLYSTKIINGGNYTQS